MLEVDHGALGALTLTSTSAAAFSREEVGSGTLFAAPAAVALANAVGHEADQLRIGQLEQGLITRQLIGQAVGLVMAAEHVDSDEAFKMLVRISQKTNAKVRELAEQLIDQATEP